MVGMLTVKLGHEDASEDPVVLLQEIRTGIQTLSTSMQNTEAALVACFRADEEYSLLSQMKLIRQEVGDTRRDVIDAFREYAEKVAQANTDALIEALQQIVKDFNVLLNELVGDAFKDLSTAMIKLTEWQENYLTCPPGMCPVL